jgi:putative ABC transport system ATP-binding protein
MVSRREAAALRRSSIGIVFRQPNLIPALTAVEQLEAMAHLGQRIVTSRRHRRTTRDRALAHTDGSPPNPLRPARGTRAPTGLSAP